MRPIITLLLFGVLLAAFGCNKNTSGGPGADLAPSEQATLGQTEDTFNLDTPMMSTKLAQGEAVALSIGITRGKNIDQDVTLMFDDLPNGVTIDPASPVIMRSEKDAKVTLKAADDASLGDFTIEVMGHPTQGAVATSELKITVGEK